MPWTFYNASGQKLSSKGKVPVSDLANGTDGELITWGTDAVATTVAVGTSGHVLTSGGTGVAPTFQAAGVTIVQEVRTDSGALVTGTTTQPLNDTIPQITEGNEVMTRTITPTVAANLLEIQVTSCAAYSTAGGMTVALYVGTTANALACGVQQIVSGAQMNVITFTHRVVAGVTTELTFRVRVGCNTGGTVTFNGDSGGRRMGGTMGSSIRIREMTP
jgi:hypothetical protein